jgi:hypothetical protein
MDADGGNPTELPNIDIAADRASLSTGPSSGVAVQPTP